MFRVVLLCLFNVLVYSNAASTKLMASGVVECEWPVPLDILVYGDSSLYGHASLIKLIDGRKIHFRIRTICVYSRWMVSLYDDGLLEFVYFDRELEESPVLVKKKVIGRDIAYAIERVWNRALMNTSYQKGCYEGNSEFFILSTYVRGEGWLVGQTRVNPGSGSVAAEMAMVSLELWALFQRDVKDDYYHEILVSLKERVFLLQDKLDGMNVPSQPKPDASNHDK